MDIKLVIVKGAKKRQAIRIRSEETIIGRQTGCDLRIPSPQVSRRHCRLSFLDDGVVVEDLASANGSFVNGVRVEGQEPIRPGDLLEIGPITFRVEYGIAVSPRAKRDKNLPLAPEAREKPTRPILDEDEELEYAEVSEEDEALPQKKVYDVIPLEEADSGDATMEVEEIPWTTKQPPSQDKIRDILSQLDKE